jgi:hypothetical protein
MPYRLGSVVFVDLPAAACREANVEALVPTDDPVTEVELATTGVTDETSGLLTTWQLVGDVAVWLRGWQATFVSGQTRELDPDVDSDTSGLDLND